MVEVDNEVLLLNNLKIELPALSIVETARPKQLFNDKQVEERLSPISGIHEYGPYDSTSTDQYLKRSFDEIELFVFYPQGESKVFSSLKYLMELMEYGYNRLTSRIDVDFDGFKQEFRLKRVHVPDRSEFISYKLGELDRVIQDHKELFYSSFRGGSIPIAIVGGTSHRSFYQNREQYIEAKRVFTSMDIPSQYVSYYEIEDSGFGLLWQVQRYYNTKSNPLGFALWNLSLNIYGKAGGIPWIVRQNISPKTNEVIDFSIGIRFSRIPNQRGYVLGHAVILDRFGKLSGTLTTRPLRLMGMKLSKYQAFRFFQDILIKALSDERVREIYGKGKREKINIAIHRLSTFHLEEIEGLKQALNKIREEVNVSEVNYGLISIIRSPLLALFDESNPYKNVVYGTALQINENTALIYTTGPLTQRAKRSMSYPIIASCVNLARRNSPFQTMSEVCNHILNVAALHWQTVIQASVRLPATLEFAQNIAKLASYGIQLKTGSWLEKTLWFL